MSDPFSLRQIEAVQCLFLGCIAMYNYVLGGGGGGDKSSRITLRGRERERETDNERRYVGWEEDRRRAESVCTRD